MAEDKRSMGFRKVINSLYIQLADANKRVKVLEKHLEVAIDDLESWKDYDKGPKVRPNQWCDEDETNFKAAKAALPDKEQAIKDAAMSDGIKRAIESADRMNRKLDEKSKAPPLDNIELMTKAALPEKGADDD